MSLSASALLNARPEHVYAVIADYREGQPGHQEILPRPPFAAMAVEAGGVGAGTKICVDMRVLGQAQSFRAVISEPEPGRVLVETNDNGMVTTFTVEPREGGRQSYVTIATALAARPGLAATLERWFVTRLMRPAYLKELALLEAVAARRKPNAER